MSDENTTHSSFAVALEPEFDEDGKWTGIISANLEEELVGDLTEDEAMQIRSVSGMIASCLQIMESDPDFLEYVKAFFVANNLAMIEEFMEDIEEEEGDEQPKFTRSKDGKVITLNFDTKTYGNA